MKILIVDDDDGLRSFLAKELEAHGCEVLQTHSGDGGLNLYKEEGRWAWSVASIYSQPRLKPLRRLPFVSQIGTPIL
jgi:CheY-like chemotaxis protein